MKTLSPWRRHDAQRTTKQKLERPDLPFSIFFVVRCALVRSKLFYLQKRTRNCVVIHATPRRIPRQHTRLSECPPFPHVNLDVSPGASCKIHLGKRGVHFFPSRVALSCNAHPPAISVFRKFEIRQAMSEKWTLSTFLTLSCDATPGFLVGKCIDFLMGFRVEF